MLSQEPLAAQSRNPDVLEAVYPAAHVTLYGVQVWLDVVGLEDAELETTRFAASQVSIPSK